MKKGSLSRKVFYVCNVLFMLLIAVVVLFPYANILAKAFNEGTDTMKGGIVIWPRVFSFENFATIFKDSAFWPAFNVSVIRVLVSVVLCCLVQYMAAYAFLDKRFIGRKFFMILLLIPMYFSGGIIPAYILYSNIGMLNNYLVYVLPGCFSVYNMIIIRSYLESIPSSLAESAKVDGANDLRVAFQIIFPLAKPVMATIALWVAVGSWNDWTTTLYYITDKSKYTLQYVLMQVLKESEKIQAIIKAAQLEGETINIQQKISTESVRCAQLIVTTLPIVVTYPFLQKYFIQGMTLGAVKD